MGIDWVEFIEEEFNVDEFGGCSDIMLLVWFDLRENGLKLFFIFWDIRVFIFDVGYIKINDVNVYGGL